MEARCLPFSNIPHTTRLFADYSGDFSRVQRFYPFSPHESGRLAESAAQLRYPAEIRAAVSDILERQNRKLGASAETLKNIQRLRNGSAAMVTPMMLTGTSAILKSRAIGASCAVAISPPAAIITNMAYMT